MLDNAQLCKVAAFPSLQKDGNSPHSDVVVGLDDPSACNTENLHVFISYLKKE